MNYKHIVKGEFICRPNRFIAHVRIQDRIEICHVKNTGRCKELLTEGVTVFLEESDNPNRKTKFDLVAVIKQNRIINMDSSAPNDVVKEWLEAGELFGEHCYIRPETTYGKSRFDFYVEAGQRKIFMEVKGVTLEQENVVRFPDAPSLRALKHVEELIQATEEGYEAYILFVVQMEQVTYFEPNVLQQPEFAYALKRASEAGVKILAYDCVVTEDSLVLHEKVPVKI